MLAEEAPPGRHRKPDPPAYVHLVFTDTTEVVLPPEDAFAHSMGQLVAMLVHRD